MSNKLAIVKDEIFKVKPDEILFMPAVKENWINSCMKTTGRNYEAAEMKFELEAALFNKQISSYKFDKVTDKFSFYIAAMELMLSDTTLSEGNSYLIPMGEQCTFMVGWKGRMEQIQQIPRVKYVHQPEVVYEGDLFDYELAPVKKINIHKRTKNTNLNVKTHVYMIVDMDHGPETYILDAKRVYEIRDTRSKPYKSYMWKKNNNALKDTDEPPMWITDEEQAFRKTVVRHAYNAMPKTDKQKHLDKIAADRAKLHNIDPDSLDEDVTDYAQYTVIPDDTPPAGTTVDKSTGEITKKK